MSSGSIQVRQPPFSSAQLASIADLHRAEVAEGFVSSLGDRALRLLYTHVASSRRCGLFLAYPAGEDEPVGYICGTADTAALYREFLLSRWWVAPRLAPQLLSPARLRRGLETLRYPHRADATLPRAEIVNFVVAPSARGSGAAEALFARLTQWFQENGCGQFKIVTGEQQQRAHGFYLKMGAQLHSHTSIHAGDRSRVYLYPTLDALASDVRR